MARCYIIPIVSVWVRWEVSLLQVAMVQFKVSMGSWGLRVVMGFNCGFSYSATNMYNHPCFQMGILRFREMAACQRSLRWSWKSNEGLCVKPGLL